MTENELIAMILNEITEYRLSQYRKEKHKDYEKLNKEISVLSKQIQLILADMENGKIVQEYISKTALLADKDCEYLYVQGAKDCIKLLKKLEII